jgi:hypothetical protein
MGIRGLVPLLAVARRVGNTGKQRILTLRTCRNKEVLERKKNRCGHPVRFHVLGGQPLRFPAKTMGLLSKSGVDLGHFAPRS